MIPYVEISNYKSVKHLKINARKVNVFIGEPNSGKSNILEALSFFSPGILEKDVFNEIIRFKTIGDLFFDNNIKNPVTVKIGDLSMELSFARNPQGAILNQFLLKFESFDKEKRNDVGKVNFQHDGRMNFLNALDFSSPVRYYLFKRLKEFKVLYEDTLYPPFGENIPTLLLSDNHLKKIVSDIFRDKKLRLMQKPAENDINIAKEVNDELYSYPYNAISETLQRIIFIMLAIESNKDAVLVFDEPETNTFPFYTKYIAERIALDETNQYFITTHNPYLLMNIIQKTPARDLNVFVTTMKNFETKVTELNDNQVEEILSAGMDAFLNLDNIAGK